MQTRNALVSRIARRAAQVAVVAASSLLLSACYVVPMQPVPGGPVQSPAAAASSVAPAANAPVTFNARMYPANELAAKYGTVQGTVTNDLHGRGIFSANILGETYSGEATRDASRARSGIANGAGSRGGWMRCSYQMNSATLGTGQCELDNGARFTMHLGG
ncbi:hypothetical protein ACFIQF_12635 [Comamonas sp. J-3]|jgi:hypothetical protein|uniref:hypothetical protein n=1 Tax=Comamonas trifloxystrobinivorans TaxID=3350256 RepID=UPI00372C37B3